MALSRMPDYDSDRITSRNGRAVVVGSGVAGLVMARVLADAFPEVIVLERDPEPGPRPRAGVPQGHHPHILLTSGRAVLEELLEGFGEEVVAAGGVTIDWNRDLRYYDEGGFVTGGTSKMPMYLASRPLIERVVRDLVTDRPAVDIRYERRLIEFLPDGDGRVTGVAYRHGETTHDLSADLVVDATGRTSRTPSWLQENGFAKPPTDHVTVDVTYTTIQVDRDPADRRLIYLPPSPPRTRGAGAFPVEGDRWLLTLWGINGDAPPTDVDDIHEFVGGLPIDTFRTLLSEGARADAGIETYPFPSSRWHHYERLERVPDGLLVAGDAVASFNPIYGQGMSVAAMQALLVHRALAREETEIDVGRLYEEFLTTITTAWRFTVGGDHRFPGTRGPSPPGTTFFNRYVAQVLRAAHDDPAVADEFAHVAMMERPLNRLFRPQLIRRVLTTRMGQAVRSGRNYLP